MVSREDIEALIGPVEVAEPVETAGHASPGRHRRHYSPITRLVLLEAGAALPPGRGVHLWLTHPAGAAKDIHMPAEPASYAAVLYDTLHGLDAEGWDWIAVEPPPETAQWAAIADRLWRAAS